MIPILIDLDGVLRINNKPVPKLNEFFQSISNWGNPACILSNSTLSTAEDVAEFFSFHDIECKIPIMTAASASAIYAKQNYHRVEVYCNEKVKRIFAEIIDNQNPEAVIIGDYGKQWDFETMNNIFRKIYNGADLIAMHKNRYWETMKDGLLLDAGPFIQAIEYASGKKAIVIGKPSHLYFKSALRLLKQSDNSKFVMIGDDIENDIAPAKELGGITIHMKSENSAIHSKKIAYIKADYEAGSIDDVLKIVVDMKQNGN